MNFLMMMIPRINLKQLCKIVCGNIHVNTTFLGLVSAYI